MEKNSDFFKSLDEIIRTIVERLDIASRELEKICQTNQKVSDLKAGLVFKNGLYLPLESIEHRIMFDGYEVQLIRVLNRFIQEMAEGGNSIFKEFAIRTISEMGLKDTQIIFSQELAKSEIENFKTIVLLADYGLLGFDHHNWAKEYKRLYEDQKNVLSPKQQVIFTNLQNNLNSGDYNENKRLVKVVRGLVNSTRDALYKKTTTPTILRAENVEVTFSAFSHLLHGNFLLLTDLLSENRPKGRNRLRIAWILLMVGLNTLIHLKEYLETKACNLEIDDLLNKFDSVSKDVANYWSEVENYA